MKLLIVADDLTGALDSAVTLANVGLRCVVARRPADLKDALASRPDVLAVSTASREGSAEDAMASVAQVFEALPVRPEIVFKKLDSRLKGHCGAELSVVKARTGIARAIVTSAIPAQGRATERGRLVGAGVDEPIDVGAALSGSDLAIEVPDARTDADLDRVVRAVLAGPPKLLVGASGLTAALARHLRPVGRKERAGRLPAPLLLAIGSYDPITLAQIDVLRATGVDEIKAYDGELPADPIRDEQNPVLVRLVVASHPLNANRAGSRFALGVAQMIGARGAGTLFVCGGETADTILGVLGVGVLDVDGEILPGVPVSTMLAHGRRMRLVTKSGGFGAPDTLVSMVKIAAGRQTGQTLWQI